MSKIVSTVMGEDFGRNRRDPYAPWNRMSSPRPTTTTTPGISPLATASAAPSSNPGKLSIPER